MKRENLKELGLDDKQIEAVMKANGQDIQALKDKQPDVDALTNERDNLNEQLKERDKDLKSLKKQVGDNEDLSKQLNEWQDKYKKDTTKLESDLKTTKLNSSLDNALNAANARNPQAVRGLLNMDSIKFDDDGKLTGLDDQLKSLHESDAYLFDEGSKTKYQPKGNDDKDDVDEVEVFKNAWNPTK